MELDSDIVLLDRDQRYVETVTNQEVTVAVNEHRTSDGLRESDFVDQLLVFRPDFDQSVVVCTCIPSGELIYIYARYGVFMIIQLWHVYSYEAILAPSLLVFIHSFDLLRPKIIVVIGHFSLNVAVPPLGLLLFYVLDIEELDVSRLKGDVERLVVNLDVFDGPVGIDLVVDVALVLFELTESQNVLRFKYEVDAILRNFFD